MNEANEVPDLLPILGVLDKVARYLNCTIADATDEEASRLKPGVEQFGELRRTVAALLLIHRAETKGSALLPVSPDPQHVRRYAVAALRLAQSLFGAFDELEEAARVLEKVLPFPDNPVAPTDHAAPIRAWIDRLRAKIYLAGEVGNLLITWPDPAGPAEIQRPDDVSLLFAAEYIRIADPPVPDDLPFIAIMPAIVLWGRVPIAPDNLPDLQVFDLPPNRWNQTGTPAASQRTKPPAPLTPLHGYVCFPSDLGVKTVIESFMRPPEWAPVDGFFRAHTHRGNGNAFHGTVGFKTDPGNQIWEFFSSRGEAAIKAHFALWARCYQETGGDVNASVTMSIPQFCQDLGYKPHHKGGFQPASKREALRMLESLTTIELAITFSTGKGKPARRIRGPLWKRGLISEESDRYDDLWGNAREGDPAQWDPVGFTYSPGDWWNDPVWRQFYHTIGRIGVGLLRLDTRHDKWAIRIGGYLATLARIGQYRSRRLIVQTILDKTGLARVDKTNPLRQRETFERAMDRLKEEGVIADWTEDLGKLEEPDMDDPDELAKLSDLADEDWRKQRIVVTWPRELAWRAPILEEAQAKHTIANAKKKPKRTALKARNDGS